MTKNRPPSERERNERLQAGAAEAAETVAALIRDGRFEDAENMLNEVGQALEILRPWAARRG